MKIKWFAHASFLIQGEGIRIITDPYTTELAGFTPILEPADLVIRSSGDDKAHSNAEMIRGEPTVVTATEIGEQGKVVKGIGITTVATQESLLHKAEPGDNAIYCFSLEGIRVAHFGDVGNRLTEDQLARIDGVNVLLIPTGGPPTIDLDDLCDAIKVLRPTITIPMHYHLPGCQFSMLPVTDFTDRFPPDRVVWMDQSEIKLTL